MEEQVKKRSEEPRRQENRRMFTRTVSDERRWESRRLCPSRRAEDYGLDHRLSTDRRRRDRREYATQPFEEHRSAERRATPDRRVERAEIYIPGVFLKAC